MEIPIGTKLQHFFLKRQPDNAEREMELLFRSINFKKSWSIEEEKFLEKAALSEGKKWAKITSMYFPDRSSIEVRNRFVSLQKKKVYNPKGKTENDLENQKRENEEESTDEICLERLKNKSTFW
jgi:hypothetical protein